MSLQRRRPDDPFSFSRAERTALLALLLVGLVGLSSGYWIKWLDGADAQAEQVSQDPAYAAEVANWVAAATAVADSVAEAKAARKERYALRQAQWAAQREQWAREKAERAQRRAQYPRRDYTSHGKSGGWPYAGQRNASPSYRNRGDSARREAEARWVDHDTPMPALNSLNPNTVDSSTLRRLGLPAGLTKRWLKYRASGGSFVSASDIGKLYGMPDTTASRLATFFTDPAPTAAPEAASPTAQSSRTPAGKSSTVVVEVNRATVEELMQIRGVGSYFAGRIIDYRGRLGGFISVEQIAETPGLRDSTFTAISAQLRVDSTYRYYIPLNTAMEWQQLRHPYMDVKAAKMTLAYRQQHGPYKSVHDLARVKALTPADIKALTPYLNFSERL